MEKMNQVIKLFRQVCRLMEEYRQKNGETVQDVRFCTEDRLFVLSRKEGRTMITVTVPDCIVSDENQGI